MADRDEVSVLVLVEKSEESSKWYVTIDGILKENVL